MDFAVVVAARLEVIVLQCKIESQEPMKVIKTA